MYADGKLMNIFESGAILQYLAEKTGKFLSQHPQVKLETIQWLFLQMANVAPMLGQVYLLLNPLWNLYGTSTFN